jgi:RNA polymerase sigma-70 factor (ECF subfamily)
LDWVVPSQQTSTSLLSRVRNPADHEAWLEFDRRYRGLLLSYCRRRGVQHVDSEDLVQKVLTNLTTTLTQFAYDPQRGRFRDYLYRSAKNAISEWAARPNRHWQPLVPDDTAAERPGGSASDPDSALWEQEWVAHHYRLALETVRRTFDARSVEIFDRSVAGAKVADLAREYGMSEQAVHKVRQRIRDRMEELIAQQVREEDDVDGSSSA